MKGRGILIVQPVIESVSGTDEQRDLMISIAKDNNGSLEYFHEAPDGHDDRQADPPGGSLTYGDYIELVHKGLD